MDIESRFWSKVRKGDDCWEWTASTGPRGYGQFNRGGRGLGMARAHRVAWELTNGPIPDGLAVCHRCDNPLCVRPDHLFLGSNAENRTDSVRKTRHAHGERMGSAKLSAADVLEIRRRHATGENRNALSAAFGIAPDHVNEVVRGADWGWLHDETAPPPVNDQSPRS